jgi:EAL and modified HD-GYP domain-containing signal transduction protein
MTLATLPDTTVFVGRQPIFDRQRKVFGYELLYRSNGMQNAYAHEDGDQATRRVIHGSLNVVGLEEMTGGKRSFINITRKLLLGEDYAVLPKEHCVVELLETVEPEAEVIEACRALKKAGYMLALDDFAYAPKYHPLLALADILKIDFLASDAGKRRWFAEKFGRSMALLAEKVETQEDFKQGMSLGYSYFQGYFFCKPEIVARKDIPAFQQNCLRFIHEVNAPKPNYGRIEETIKHDLSLSTKFLKYLNSAAMGMSNRITSIKQGLALLGEKPLRKWATMVALAAMGQEKPSELIVTALVRGRFCEQIAAAAGLVGRELDLFLMGLFSVMDALLDQPLEKALSYVPLPADVTAALLGTNESLGRAYGLALALERGQWTRARGLAGQMGVEPERLSEMYRGAVKWADQNNA